MNGLISFLNVSSTLNTSSDPPGKVEQQKDAVESSVKGKEMGTSADRLQTATGVWHPVREKEGSLAGRSPDSRTAVRKSYPAGELGAPQSRRSVRHPTWGKNGFASGPHPALQGGHRLGRAWPRWELCGRSGTTASYELTSLPCHGFLPEGRSVQHTMADTPHLSQAASHFQSLSELLTMYLTSLTSLLGSRAQGPHLIYSWKCAQQWHTWKGPETLNTKQIISNLFLQEWSFL